MSNHKYILLKRFVKFSSGMNRKFGLFECVVCECEFESRIERISVMSGLCKPCADVKSGLARRTHGYSNSNSRLHVTWSNMKRRCLNPTEREKKNYSGITVCNDWLGFEGFMSWANKNGYNEKLTIDRIDNDIGYCPSNCRFVDYSTQSSNRKKTIKNKSGYVGVFERASGKFISYVDWRNKRYRLGSFLTAREAAIVRDKYITDNNLPHTLNNIQ